MIVYFEYRMHVFQGINGSILLDKPAISSICQTQISV